LLRNGVYLEPLNEPDLNQWTAGVAGGMYAFAASGISNSGYSSSVHMLMNSIFDPTDTSYLSGEWSTINSWGWGGSIYAWNAHDYTDPDVSKTLNSCYDTNTGGGNCATSAIGTFDNWINSTIGPTGNSTRVWITESGDNLGTDEYLCSWLRDTDCQWEDIGGTWQWVSDDGTTNPNNPPIPTSDPDNDTDLKSRWTDARSATDVEYIAHGWADQTFWYDNTDGSSSDGTENTGFDSDWDSGLFYAPLGWSGGRSSWCVIGRLEGAFGSGVTNAAINDETNCPTGFNSAYYSGWD
jgi:hypothetical protein